jgi:predicted membrane chloride channel (bestrophin family)
LSKEDDFRELDRRFRRTVYDHEEWKSHRSLFRYVRSIAQIHRSSILRAIAVPVAFTTVFATLVCTYNAAIAKGIIKATLPQLVIPQALINLPSFCLSLLLVFRTNASYGRFDEARKMWGLMLNRSRDLTRQAVSYFPPHAIAAKRMLARWTIAM